LVFKIGDAFFGIKIAGNISNFLPNKTHFNKIPNIIITLPADPDKAKI
jgi:hypothetical protein